MKPDACIDLLKAFKDLDIRTVTQRVERSVNGNKVPAWTVEAYKKNGVGVCLYEFAGNMFCVNDEDGVKMYTDVDDVVFYTRGGCVTAMINRKIGQAYYKMYEEVIYGRQEGEYVVRTV